MLTRVFNPKTARVFRKGVEELNRSLPIIVTGPLPEPMPLPDQSPLALPDISIEQPAPVPVQTDMPEARPSQQYRNMLSQMRMPSHFGRQVSIDQRHFSPSYTQVRHLSTVPEPQVSEERVMDLIHELTQSHFDYLGQEVKALATGQNMMMRNLSDYSHHVDGTNDKVQELQANQEKMMGSLVSALDLINRLSDKVNAMDCPDPNVIAANQKMDLLRADLQNLADAFQKTNEKKGPVTREKAETLYGQLIHTIEDVYNWFHEEGKKNQEDTPPDEKFRNNVSNDFWRMVNLLIKVIAVFIIYNQISDEFKKNISNTVMNIPGIVSLEDRKQINHLYLKAKRKMLLITGNDQGRLGLFHNLRHQVATLVEYDKDIERLEKKLSKASFWNRAEIENDIKNKKIDWHIARNQTNTDLDSYRQTFDDLNEVMDALRWEYELLKPKQRETISHNLDDLEEIIRDYDLLKKLSEVHNPVVRYLNGKEESNTARQRHKDWAEEVIKDNSDRQELTNIGCRLLSNS